MAQEGNLTVSAEQESIHQSVRSRTVSDQFAFARHPVRIPILSPETVLVELLGDNYINGRFWAQPRPI